MSTKRIETILSPFVNHFVFNAFFNGVFDKNLVNLPFSFLSAVYWESSSIVYWSTHMTKPRMVVNLAVNFLVFNLSYPMEVKSIR